MYIVCYTLRLKKSNVLPQEYEFRSDYIAFESIEEAQTTYDRLFRQDNLYSATLCKPIKSTETTYLEENK
tara:strand:+ start:913 stop:1122 length:210 start_codon:yes stop_codon:yes gene_type:complete